MFGSGLVKEAARSLGKDFAAGIDPFGNWTSQYAQDTQRAHASEAEHKKRQLVGTAGGLLGGAVAVPVSDLRCDSEEHRGW